jgi:hypothetical protein
MPSETRQLSVGFGRAFVVEDLHAALRRSGVLRRLRTVTAEDLLLEWEECGVVVQVDSVTATAGRRPRGACGWRGSSRSSGTTDRSPLNGERISTYLTLTRIGPTVGASQKRPGGALTPPARRRR